MARDSQLSKAYTAIGVAGTRFAHPAPLGLGITHTPDELCAEIQKILNSAWFQKRWHGTPLLVKTVTIREMQNTTYCEPYIWGMKQRANAKREPHGVEFRLAPDQVTLVQMLHIATHFLRPDWNHNPEFCKEFLAVVGRFMGADAKKMMTEIFRANRVKTRVYSDEARQAASARMRARDLMALRDELLSD